MTPLRKKEAMTSAKRERYIRWEGYRINQLSLTINLFLGFAVASLAYSVNLKLEGKAVGAIPLDTVIFWWAASGALGSIASISKFCDYRFSARKIKDGGEFNKCAAKLCGYTTLGCFLGQVISYVIGAYLFLTRLLIGVVA